MGKFELTLYEYKDELNWVQQMGWSDDELRQVPVHEQATAGEDYLNLANFGGTNLGVTARGGPTSAAVHNIHNMYIYEREVPERLYKQLKNLVDRGGPSAYEEDGVFGERGEASSFPPES